jgi:hypothetical protein
MPVVVRKESAMKDDAVRDDAVQDDAMRADMAEVAFAAADAAVVERMRDAGIALDVMRLRAPTGGHSVEWSHRVAVVFAVSAFARARGRDPGPTDPAVPVGRPVDARDLLGQAVDRPTRRLWAPTGTVFAPQKDPFARCSAVSEDSADVVAGAYVDRATGQRVWLVEDPAGVPLGLAEVFGSSPLGIRIGVEEVDELFAAFTRDVLRVDDVPVEGWFWVGDWSPYFDEGREWWGAYAWTVRTDAEHVVVVGASATD